MKHNSLISLTGIGALLIIFLSSCELAEGIFNAGMGVGIFVVIAVIALIIFIIMRISRRG